MTTASIGTFHWRKACRSYSFIFKSPTKSKTLNRQICLIFQYSRKSRKNDVIQIRSLSADFLLPIVKTHLTQVGLDTFRNLLSRKLPSHVPVVGFQNFCHLLIATWCLNWYICQPMQMTHLKSKMIIHQEWDSW